MRNTPRGPRGIRDVRKRHLMQEKRSEAQASDCSFPLPCGCVLCAPEPYDETDERA